MRIYGRKANPRTSQCFPIPQPVERTITECVFPIKQKVKRLSYPFLSTHKLFHSNSCQLDWRTPQSNPQSGVERQGLQRRGLVHCSCVRWKRIGGSLFCQVFFNSLFWGCSLLLTTSSIYNKLRRVAHLNRGVKQLHFVWLNGVEYEEVTKNFSFFNHGSFDQIFFFLPKVVAEEV